MHVVERIDGFIESNGLGDGEGAFNIAKSYLLQLDTTYPLKQIRAGIGEALECFFECLTIGVSLFFGTMLGGNIITRENWFKQTVIISGTVALTLFAILFTIRFIRGFDDIGTGILRDMSYDQYRYLKSKRNSIRIVVESDGDCHDRGEV